MNLKNLSDEMLISTSDRLVQEERERLTVLLHHLKEIEARRLFSSMGYKSLFDYATKRWGYSEDQAARRIAAMRLLKDLPQIEEKITDGTLNLTVLGKAQTLFRQEKKNNPFSSEQKLEILEKLENKSTREAEKIVLQLSSQPGKFQPEKVRQVSDNLVELKLITSEKTFEKIEKLKGLLAHSSPNISTADLIDKLCDLGLQKWDLGALKREVKTKDKAFANAAVLPAAPKKRRATTQKSKRTYISIQAKREIWRKAQSQCEICKSNYALEIDHIKPLAQGGTNKPTNLRLLCKSCNQRQAIEKLGGEQMQVFL